MTFFFFFFYNIASVVLCAGLLAIRHVGSYFPDQGLNPHLLHWKGECKPLDHPGSPTLSLGFEILIHVWFLPDPASSPHPAATNNSGGELSGCPLRAGLGHVFTEPCCVPRLVADLRV